MIKKIALTIIEMFFLFCGFMVVVAFMKAIIESQKIGILLKVSGTSIGGAVGLVLFGIGVFVAGLIWD